MLLAVEIVCSDSIKHRPRVEQHVSEVPGHLLPTWTLVIARHYEPWSDVHLVLNSGRTSENNAVSAVLAALHQRVREPHG